MSFYPKVSVIIRTCQRFGLLELALNSVISQTYNNIEIIIVDDGTCKIDQDFLQEYGNKVQIKLVFPNTQGRSSAANAGIKEASGSFLCFLDDDDEYLPQHLAILVNGSLSAEGLVYTNALHSFEKYNAITNELELIARRKILYQSFDKQFLLFSNTIPLHSILFPKAALEGTFFDEDLSLFEDWDLLIRLSENHPFTHIDEDTCIYRIWSDEQISRSDDEAFRLKAYQQVLGKHFAKLSPEVISIWWNKTSNEIQLLKEELADLRNHYDKSQDKLTQLVAREENYAEQDRLIKQLRIELEAVNSRCANLHSELNLKQQTLALYIQENEDKECIIHNLQHEPEARSTKNLLKVIILRILPGPVTRLLLRIKHKLSGTLANNKK